MLPVGIKTNTRPLVPMFPDRMGIEETGNVRGTQIFYKPGGCWVLLSSRGQYPVRCTWKGRVIGDDRNVKETWTWQRRGARGKGRGRCKSERAGGRKDLLKREEKRKGRTLGIGGKMDPHLCRQTSGEPKGARNTGRWLRPNRAGRRSPL